MVKTADTRRWLGIARGSLRRTAAAVVPERRHVRVLRVLEHADAIFVGVASNAAISHSAAQWHAVAVERRDRAGASSYLHSVGGHDAVARDMRRVRCCRRRPGGRPRPVLARSGCVGIVKVGVNGRAAAAAARLMRHECGRDVVGDDRGVIVARRRATSACSGSRGRRRAGSRRRVRPPRQGVRRAAGVCAAAAPRAVGRRLAPRRSRVVPTRRTSEPTRPRRRAPLSGLAPEAAGDPSSACVGFCRGGRRLRMLLFRGSARGNPARFLPQRV